MSSKLKRDSSTGQSEGRSRIQKSMALISNRRKKCHLIKLDPISGYLGRNLGHQFRFALFFIDT
jgi:hypothetical protein